MPQQKPYNVTILKQRGLQAYESYEPCLEGYPPVVEIMHPLEMWLSHSSSQKGGSTKSMSGFSASRAGGSEATKRRSEAFPPKKNVGWNFRKPRIKHWIWKFGRCRLKLGVFLLNLLLEHIYIYIHVYTHTYIYKISNDTCCRAYFMKSGILLATSSCSISSKIRVTKNLNLWIWSNVWVPLLLY